MQNQQPRDLTGAGKTSQTQQRQELPMLTLTWHVSKYKTNKLHQRYILKKRSPPHPHPPLTKWHPPLQAHSVAQVCTGIRQNPFQFQTCTLTQVDQAVKAIETPVPGQGADLHELSQVKEDGVHLHQQPHHSIAHIQPGRHGNHVAGNDLKVNHQTLKSAAELQIIINTHKRRPLGKSLCWNQRQIPLKELALSKTHFVQQVKMTKTKQRKSSILFLKSNLEATFPGCQLGEPDKQNTVKCHGWPNSYLHPLIFVPQAAWAKISHTELQGGWGLWQVSKFLAGGCHSSIWNIACCIWNRHLKLILSAISTVWLCWHRITP